MAEFKWFEDVLVHTCNAFLSKFLCDLACLCACVCACVRVCEENATDHIILILFPA